MGGVGVGAGKAVAGALELESAPDALEAGTGMGMRTGAGGGRRIGGFGLSTLSPEPRTAFSDPPLSLSDVLSRFELEL